MKTILKFALLLLVFSLLPLAGTVEAAGVKPPAFGSSNPISIQTVTIEVSKTYDVTTTREYDWTVTKQANVSELTLSPGQSYLVNYTVVADVSGWEDTGAYASGTITITNPVSSIATFWFVGVTESLPGAIVDCPAPEYVSPGETLTCTYTAAITGEVPPINYATIEYQYPEGESHTVVAQANAAITANEIDECAYVTDSLAGPLGQVCVGAAPATFTYSYLLTAPEMGCGIFYLNNTAMLEELDTHEFSNAMWTVVYNVPCGGCTLTPGYWKTHSSYGPAPYDATWAMVPPSGENSPFYSNNKTWYQMLWMNVAGGNAYIRLSHAYIAARLNQYNGADVSVISGTLAQAETFLQNYNYWSILNKTVRAQMTSLASTLDQYNNGFIGPGHCSE